MVAESGLSETCPKCRGTNLLVRYHPARRLGCNESLGLADWCRGGSKEHMVMHCRRCQYRWYEQPLDVREEVVL